MITTMKEWTDYKHKEINEARIKNQIEISDSMKYSMKYSYKKT